jgi:hypothetical protein
MISAKSVRNLNSMRETVIASILHGAYGDYYEQAVCLKNLRLSQPNTRLKLFAASPHRLAELRVLDFSWADYFELFTEIPEHGIDRFFQFQAHDPELRAKVFSKLPPSVLAMVQSEPNRRPWHSLRSILPLAPAQQLGLSQAGRDLLPQVMRDNGINPNIFQGPTVGFLWRHRTSSGYVKSTLQVDAAQLVEKYSRLFRRLIDSHACHILICGMKVPRTPENMHRIDAKYPDYGLDLPGESATHLRGLSWALELEILSRCTVCVVNASGFSEALWIKRGAGVLLVDPPPHYLAKMLWHRMPFFNLRSPGAFLASMTSRLEGPAFAAIRAELDRSLRADNHIVPNVHDLVQ